MTKTLREGRLLGFDAREMWLATGALSAVHTASDFLFRLDVEKVLSTDTAVWPSVFDLDGDWRPPYVGSYPELWEDLEELRNHLTRAEDHRVTPCYLIAIVLRRDQCNDEEKGSWDRLLRSTNVASEGEIDAPPLGAAASPWTILGYDVSDQFLVSGLSDCGFLPDIEDVQSLRDKWAPRLNDFHLFDELADAAEFRELSNERVKEHAPFFIFEIWLVDRLD